MRKRPSEPVEAALRKPVARFLTEILALATTAPVGSETVPRTEPVVWAQRAAVLSRSAAAVRRSGVGIGFFLGVVTAVTNL